MKYSVELGIAVAVTGSDRGEWWTDTVEVDIPLAPMSEKARAERVFEAAKVICLPEHQWAGREITNVWMRRYQ